MERPDEASDNKNIISHDQEWNFGRWMEALQASNNDDAVTSGKGSRELAALGGDACEFCTATRLRPLKGSNGRGSLRKCREGLKVKGSRELAALGGAVKKSHKPRESRAATRSRRGRSARG